MPKKPADIPLLSIQAQNAALSAKIKKAVDRTIDSGIFILGPEGKAFEQEFASALGSSFCLGVDSGTSALELALEALGIGPGDEVIVPTFTFIATASAVSCLGATPVFADVNEETLTLDPESVEALITARTKAMIPVHLFGQPADMDSLLALAEKKWLFVIEDCAQSHLASDKGRMTGTLGNAGTFSFYPTKNLGAAGDAGAITLSDPALRDRILELRNCGRAPGAAYHHVRIGHNCRLDEIQAAILRVKLGELKAWTESRRRLARLYHAGLAELPLRLPPLGGSGIEPVFHLFTVRTERRDQLAEHLKRQGIGCGVYYPTPVHRQPAYSNLDIRIPLPVSERASSEVLSLPMFAELRESDVARVCEAVRAFFH